MYEQNNITHYQHQMASLLSLMAEIFFHSRYLHVEINDEFEKLSTSLDCLWVQSAPAIFQRMIEKSLMIHFFNAYLNGAVVVSSVISE